jgi:hypothetical protein
MTGHAPEADPAKAAAPQSRRSVLKRSLTAATAAAAAAVGVRSLASPHAAEAANGQPVLLGKNANDATLQTVVRNTAAGGKALVGLASNTTQSGASAGVYGQSNASQGFGVYGVGHTGIHGRGNALPNSWGVGGSGVYGVVGAGTTRGVTGYGPQGVSGFATGSNSTGTYGEGDFGVFGRGNAGANSYGVYGAGPFGLVGHGTKHGVTGTGPFALVGAGTTRGVTGTGPIGVYGASSTANGAGVYGQGDYGVYGKGNVGAQSYGLYGTGPFGVVADGTSVAVWGDGGTYGVRAYGTTAGIYADCAPDPQGFQRPSILALRGIRAWPSGGSIFYAGEFVGAAIVHGPLWADDYEDLSGAVRMDHPLDPANRYLRHAKVASPDMLNIYSGSVVLNARGEARVQLPPYFEALNSNPRVQLTAVGAPAPNLHLSREVDRGRFRIAGGGPGQTVFWQVTGVRQDAYARKHRVKVESRKAPRDRGKYLAPEVHGKSRSERIGYVKRPRKPSGPKRTNGVATAAGTKVPTRRPGNATLPGRFREMPELSMP